MKKLFTLIGAIALTCNLMAVNVWDGTSEPWTNGNGTYDDPYLIETASNLAYLAEKVNEGYQAQGMAVFAETYFLMTEDLDLNNINWTPIGYVNTSLEGFYFAGVFDGAIILFCSSITCSISASFLFCCSRSSLISCRRAFILLSHSFLERC